MSGVWITGRGAVTPAGAHFQACWRALAAGVPRIALDEEHGSCGRLREDGEAALARLAGERRHKSNDRGVLLGVLAAREAWNEAIRGGAAPDPARTAAVIGSSRGATGTIERELARLLESGKVAAGTSPRSTAGAFATEVSQDLGLGGPAFFVSSACATGLNAIGTAYALVAGGVADAAIAGGAEASLTPFTFAQLAAVKVAAKGGSRLYPCRPLHPDRSGMVPGEGAACVMLSRTPGARPLARVVGFGAATETATATGISEGGEALVRAAHAALAQAGAGPGDVALVVGHGAGTLKGDAAELAAYRVLFDGALPPLTFHKWLTGHMIGASAAFSAALATEHLASGEVPALPYWEGGEGGMEVAGGPFRLAGGRGLVLVAGLGFGGSASALLLAPAR